jgi:hypothetical protein
MSENIHKIRSGVHFKKQFSVAHLQHKLQAAQYNTGITIGYVIVG